MFDSNDSDSETDLEALFQVEDPNNAVFYFRRIAVKVGQAENGSDSADDCTVEYMFNFNNKVDLTSQLRFRAPRTTSVEQLASNILAIGLCMLPWYWMGFATPRIVIEPSALQLQVQVLMGTSPVSSRVCAVPLTHAVWQRVAGVHVCEQAGLAGPAS